MKQLSISVALFILASTLLAAPNISLEEKAEPPAKLSEIGLFVNLEKLTAIDEMIPYEVNQSLWVDHAKKKRWIYLPKEAQRIKFSKNKSYEFPVGSILVKHFSMETSKEQYRKIETRLLIHKRDNFWVGYTYQWKGSDAYLVPEGERPVVQLNIDATAKGGKRIQDFKIPSRNDCLSCHNPSVGFVRSFRTEQLNRTIDGENQLDKLNSLKIFSNIIGDTKNLPKLSSIDDISASLEERVASYLSVNCAHCHNPDPAAPCRRVGIDLRYGHSNLQDIVDGDLIIPGNKEDSYVYQLMQKEEGFRMPMIGRDIKHGKALKILGQWIDGLN